MYKHKITKTTSHPQPQKKILVVGGAGYIGSHMVDLLVKRGYEAVVFDNLATGHADAVLNARLIEADLADTAALEKCFSQHNFTAVMHFAALIQVGESVSDPAKYYRNNVANTLNLLDAMLRHKVDKFIFSSSAAVYGEPKYTPIDVDHPKNPVNPYGRSKWMIEQVLQDYDQAYQLRSISLRYFNAAGADPQGRLGERHNPESHLIPLILQAATGHRPAINVYGHDYPTPDGTCIRDYVHIVDLCSAHLCALEKLCAGAPSNAFNLGNGKGYSVLEVIKTVEKITHHPINIVQCARRVGDPAVLLADATRAQQELGWIPQYSALETIIEHAWKWEQIYEQNRQK
jgi:UDP-glucose 4-epimerase